MIKRYVQVKGLRNNEEFGLPEVFIGNLWYKLSIYKFDYKTTQV